MQLNRRRFLAVSAAAAASARSFAQIPSAAQLTLHADQPLATMPENFIGLSYETQQLGDPTFFSPASTGLIAQFRALAPHGVLRIGGNTSDVGWWKPTPDAKMPPLPPNVVLQKPGPDERPPLDLAYAVTPEAVRNLRGFLDATGWTCLYGINLGTNTPERAADEAEFVHKTLGDKLEYFQLGNEPDLLAHRFRVKANWNVDAYFHDWLALANAVRARVPSAQFGMPDISGSAAWFAPLADKLTAMSNPPKIAAVTHHYYFGGPPSNPKVNIPALLQPNPRVLRDAALVTAAAARLHTRYRMTEGNTCYRGGKPGVSDVFAATLWAADYLLQLASLGYAGVNLHGGRGKDVADSLGGTLPGELLMPDRTAPHPRPFYTPIDSHDGRATAQPVYFGMLFAQHFAGARMVHLDFDPAGANATAYAAVTPKGKQLIAIINKDATQNVDFRLPHSQSRSVAHLSASAPDSRTVLWNGQPIDTAARATHAWQPILEDIEAKTDNIHVPPMTAVLTVIG